MMLVVQRLSSCTAQVLSNDRSRRRAECGLVHEKSLWAREWMTADFEKREASELRQAKYDYDGCFAARPGVGTKRAVSS